MKTNIKLLLTIVCTGMVFISCTDLDLELRDKLTDEDAVAFVDRNGLEPFVRSAYLTQRRAFMGFGSEWHLEEWSADAVFTPTRGSDWFDNGTWRALHTHTWSANHPAFEEAFENILQVVFQATDVLFLEPEPQVAAEMKVLRAKAVITALSLWGQVPFRNNFDDFLESPIVLTAEEAYQFALEDITSAMPDLPEDGPALDITKNSARALLMQLYLNKGAYLTPANPTFDSSDMDKIIVLADEVIATGKYNLDCNYFDNFLTTNDVDSCENIWTIRNDAGVGNNRMQVYWLATLGQEQGPGGWNGFCVLGDFYDTFVDTDERFYGEEDSNKMTYGLNLGFLEGQQFDQNDVPLTDGQGLTPPILLDYSKDVELFQDGLDQRIKGIRVLKYNIDVSRPSRPANDAVVFRYAQVLMMKAEALYRKSDVGGATVIVNELRNARNLVDLPVTLDDSEFLKELGREFYLEGKRRSDMIRFGTFLEPFQLKDNTDDEFRLKFALPAAQVTLNKNLDQNPGY